MEEEGKEKRKRADEKHTNWELFRISTAFLKEQEPKWRTRTIEECARIKAIEKQDRMAIERK